MSGILEFVIRETNWLAHFWRETESIDSPFLKKTYDCNKIFMKKDFAVARSCGFVLTVMNFAFWID